MHPHLRTTTTTTTTLLLLCIGAGLALAQAAGDGATTASTALCDGLAQHQACLSPNATIRCGARDVRWSDYAAPQPGAVVTVGTEADVAVVVAAANALNASFLVRAGGNGWADTFDLGADGAGLVVDLSALRAVRFSDDRAEVALQAGVLIEDLVAAAWDAGARVATGTCNCVSVLGAGLGGGVGRGTGLYGLGLDQLLSVNYVDAEGRAGTVTADSDPDLWWALRGAGPNFGVVTSVVYKSYPVAQEDNTAWTGLLYYDPSQIEDVVAAIDNLTLEAEMQLDFYFTQGAVAVLPFYLGSEAAGRDKFASLLALGPLADATEVLPYASWNAAGDSFCADGGRKPTYATNLQAMDPAAWRAVWDEYSAFYGAHAEANATTILTECYSTATAVALGRAQPAAYPWRDVKCYSIAIPWYTSEALDDEANRFGQAVRSRLSATAGTYGFGAYVNFAHGDEDLVSIYGDSLSRLQGLKQKYDPKGRFNQWFPLS